jgi:hypothetical protein
LAKQLFSHSGFVVQSDRLWKLQTENENKQTLDLIAGIRLLCPMRFIISAGTARDFLTGNSHLVWAVVGEGVQIYEAKANPAGGYQWTLKMPEAELKDLSGQLVGKHFAGPGWSANDGSEVVGALPPLKTWTSHDSKNIAWLLVAWLWTFRQSRLRGSDLD